MVDIQVNVAELAVARQIQAVELAVGSWTSKADPKLLPRPGSPQRQAAAAVTAVALLVQVQAVQVQGRGTLLLQTLVA